MPSGRLIVVAGENLVDRIVRPDGRVDEIAGGGPFNTARALGRLGAQVAYLGRISTDAPGRRLREALIDDGVDLSLASSTDDPTLIAHATLDSHGVATYRFDWEGSAAAGLRPEDLPASLPPDMAALHIGTLGLVLEPTATTIEQLVARVGRDVLVMVDPNIRPSAIANEAVYRRRLDAVIERADVIKASKEDADWIRSDGTFHHPNDDDGSLGHWALIETAGPSFVEVTTPKGSGLFRVPPRQVVDTVGAGDGFSAGFLARWVEAGHPRSRISDPEAIAPAVRYAIAVAGHTVERAGADPPWAADIGDDEDSGR